MKVILHKQLDLSAELDKALSQDSNIDNDRSELIYKCIKQLKGDASKILKPINFLDNIYVDKENNSVFSFNQPGDKPMLVLPLVLSINQYADFLSTLNNIKSDQFQGCAYYNGRTPYLSGSIERWKPVKMDVKLWAISSNSISICIDLTNHPINSSLEYIAQKIGYMAISRLFPQLSGMELRSDRTIIERQEYALTNRKILIY